jgi:hypothetical protein
MPSPNGDINKRPDFNFISTPLSSCPKSVLRYDEISIRIIVLRMMGMKAEKYYESEVVEFAINVSRINLGGITEHIAAIDTLTPEKIS